MPESYTLSFTKMQGCANDFMVTHRIPMDKVHWVLPHVPALCDRRRGVGADGLILVLPSETADFAMRIFNADGSEAEMCGNGIRCLARYVKKLGLTGKDALTIETLAGPISTTLKGELVRVNMGAPVLEAEKIPTQDSGGPVIGKDLTVDGRSFRITAVSMGNPHAVVYADELTDELVLDWGRKLESHPFFPRKVNVEFIRVLSPFRIDMRVFERGCGETMACGTGACASVVAGILNKKHGTAVTVRLRGGDLFVEWDGAPGHQVFMTGPAEEVFEGTVKLSM